MKHDENKDLKSVARIAKIDYSNKTIQASKNANIGIHTWGRIDFLTHYCGWHFVWNNSVGVGGYVSDTSAIELKKDKEEHKLKNKRR